MVKLLWLHKQLHQQLLCLGRNCPCNGFRFSTMLFFRDRWETKRGEEGGWMQRPTLLDAPDVNIRINHLIAIHRANVLSCSQLPVLYSSRCLRRSASWSCSVVLGVQDTLRFKLIWVDIVKWWRLCMWILVCLSFDCWVNWLIAGFWYWY